MVEEEARALPFTAKILRRLEGVPVEYVETFDLKSRDLFTGSGPDFTRGKRTLLLKVSKGFPIKICPGYSDEVVCCNYHVLDFVENCPLECTYCILQAYHSHPVVVFHVNVEEILAKIGRVLGQRNGSRFRIGTGEHSDSLALDHLFGLNASLVEFFGAFPNALLELKTKDDYVEPLLDLNHRGRTVVSWSVNSERITRENEFKTATLKAKLEAARKLVGRGYPVGFHFDPLIEHSGWKAHYLDVVRRISLAVPREKIAWISMGTLRYLPRLKRIAEDRFGNTRVFAGESVEGTDGKRRYYKEIREELIRTVGGFVKEYFPGTPNYLCMENSRIWQKTQDRIPDSDSALEEEIFKGAERACRQRPGDESV